VIAVLAGGVGAARLLRGLVRVVDPADVIVVANTGDDLVLHGLHISPDLDTITYTLAEAGNPETGWGLAGETWQAMDALDRYGGPSWFRLGDRDLGTHLFRTGRLSEGAGLAGVTAEIAAAWELGFRLLPATEDHLRTMVTLADGGEVGFQEYFVGLRHDVPVSGIRFEGADDALPGPGVLEAITTAEAVVVAPSNPLVSIAPILAVPGIADVLKERRTTNVAVSPIVGGSALKGPADRMLAEMGHESSVVGVARLYRDLVATLVIDRVDADLADEVEAEGVRCVVTDTVMRTTDVAATLAKTAIEAVA
jgi:LPPG:FO 2-phospho-L-lactate transferase|tara:strand:+ start:1708 stop:2634 length:927 start_codon:yes stop_codon:yes gene_type:complete